MKNVCIVLLMLIAPLFAEESAVDVVEAYFKTQKNKEAEKAVELIHPDAIENYKKVLLKVPAAQQGYMLQSFGFKDLEEFKKTSAKEVFIRTLKNVLAQLGPDIEFKTLGVTLKEDTAYVVYETSMKLNGMDYYKLSPLSLQKHEGKWRILLTKNVEDEAPKQVEAPKVEANSPEQLVMSSFSAMQKGDVAACVKLFHQKDLGDFYNNMVTELKSISAEGQNRFISTFLKTIKSMKDLESASPELFMEEIFTRVVAQFQQQYQGGSLQFLGRIEGKDGKVYILYNILGQTAMFASRVEVDTLRSDNGKWYLALDEEILFAFKMSINSFK
ncbi:hypothetical protein [Candidatus Uabimicrobium amorphum]|uniref:SnoaL-like domain-containing protein n=1 Tax=Uabimicrobium amorphum TaxID=2596890 RepID=A0A5S9F838_UABAM|nr:hypothetical protein [Candidatus Uabimicrobium amorphum]BBM88294.1 hypothetical protein UABAM_06715 [Candidatus Uabimicrobium amorphum]